MQICTNPTTANGTANKRDRNATLILPCLVADRRITGTASTLLSIPARAPPRQRARKVTHMKVAVVGLRYVRFVTAAWLAAHGHDVWGGDVDPVQVDEICARPNTVAEPCLDALV